jgi:hypothetical protein
LEKKISIGGAENVRDTQINHTVSIVAKLLPRRDVVRKNFMGISLTMHR